MDTGLKQLSNLKERDNQEDLDIKGDTVLKWALKKSGRAVWAGLLCHEIGIQ